jgi:hypothetical protein
MKRRNTSNRRRRTRRSTHQSADDIALELVDIGLPAKVPAFEAIVRQLWQKAMAGDGDPEALKILLKYDRALPRISKAKVELTFLDPPKDNENE